MSSPQRLTSHLTKSPVMVVPFAHAYRRWFDVLAEAVQLAGLRLVLTGGLSDAVFGTTLRYSWLDLSGPIWREPFFAARNAIGWLGTPLPLRSIFNLASSHTKLENLIRPQFTTGIESLLSDRARRALREAGGYRFAAD